MTLKLPSVTLVYHLCPLSTLSLGLYDMQKACIGTLVPLAHTAVRPPLRALILLHTYLLGQLGT